MVDPVSTLSVLVGVVLGGVLLLWMMHYSSGWHKPSKSGARLPNGSLGWPIIGESLELARNPLTYATSHFKRYGSVFKSSLLLQRTIVGTTPEFAKFVLSNSDLFVSGWPAFPLGPKAFAHKHGPEHTSVKKILQKPLLPESLRSKLEVLEAIILENLASWAQRGTVVATDAAPKIILDAIIFLLLGVRDICSTPEGSLALENLKILTKATLSPPVNLPGTPFNKALKAKASLAAYLKGLLQKSKQEGNTQDDMLGVLSAAQEDPQAREEVKDLDDDTVVDNLLFMWFAAFDTSRTVLTWTLKFLVDNPDVFVRIQAEQQEIFEGKDLSGEEPRLTWDDTRKMVYASKFLQELQRTISIAPMVIRKAVQDVEYDGYLIPKGWRVAPMYKFIHADPAIYPEPERFNPNRFHVAPRPFTYLPFSAGPHGCPGMDIVKLISLIYIHHVTTTYVFESAAPDRGMEYNNLPSPVGGYPINIRRRY